MHALLETHLHPAGGNQDVPPANWSVFLSRLDEALSADDKARREMEAELRLAQKLEAVGQLAAGIAHEINTPVQYVGDTLQFLESAVEQLRGYAAVAASVEVELANAPSAAIQVARLRQAAEDADLEYLLRRLPEAFVRATDGMGRVAALVRALKDFAHPDSGKAAPADLNKAIETTLVVSKNEYKYVATTELELGDIPLVACHIGQVNQVLLNLVVNAAHAIGDRKSETLGRIRIRTSSDNGHVTIAVEDDGMGIPLDIRDRVFDPFFTTKEVGRGTGQGLAIARTIVVDRHHGTLTCTSTPGVGTTFHVRLPIAGPEPT